MSDALSFLACKQICSISSQYFLPSQWKKTFVRSLFKNGARNLFASYRRFSNLSRLSLAFEGIDFAPLNSFVPSKIYPLQFWFVRKRSKVSQLLVFVDDFSKLYDKYVPFKYSHIDFSKKFQRVPHHIRLEKLHNIDIGGNLLFLFFSDLCGRRQCYLFGFYLSSFKIFCRASQGSVLGPFLIIIFTIGMEESSVFDCSSLCKSY